MNKRPTEVQNIPDTAAPASSLPKDLWLGSCARYTVLCMLLLLISTLLAESPSAVYVDPIRFALLLPFALCLTGATMLRRTDKLSRGAKCALHPLAVLGGFYTFGYLPFQLRSKPSGQQILLFLLLAALVYGLAMGIYCLITHSLGRKKSEDTPYVSQFGKKQ